MTLTTSARTFAQALPRALAITLVSVGVVAATTGCDAQRDATLDALVCEDALRPSTARALQAAWDHPDADALAALVTPQDLARVVAFVPQAEAVVVVGRNVWSIVDSGFGKDVVEHGWDGVQCGEPVTLQCTAGSGVSVVDCDDDDSAFAITQQLEGCTLHGVIVSGVVVLGKDDDDRVTVDVDVVVDEVREVRGAFVVDDHGLRSTGPIGFRDHPGTGCAGAYTFDDLAVQADGDTTRLAVVGAVDDDDHDVAVDSGGVYDGTSLCPRAGAQMVVAVPRPFDEEHSAAVAIHFGEDGVSVDVDGHDAAPLAAAVQALCGP